MKNDLSFSSLSPPNVLFLGNGVLRLNGGGSWDALIHCLNEKSVSGQALKQIPYAMQPEVLCGVDVEEVQRRTAEHIQDAMQDSAEVLNQLVSLPFDAILTTNYTYEIESALCGHSWTDSDRKKSFLALDGKPHVRNNTCICSLLRCQDGRLVPVFHVHGERLRKHSLILSYYSYANAVSRLIQLNKLLGNEYKEKQDEAAPIVVRSWLDYFLMGNVYAVGFGFDPSEFDIWWAVERKAREKAIHGKLFALMTETNLNEKPQCLLFDAMNVEHHLFVPVGDNYQKAYGEIIAFLKEQTDK